MKSVENVNSRKMTLHVIWYRRNKLLASRQSNILLEKWIFHYSFLFDFFTGSWRYIHICEGGKKRKNYESCWHRNTHAIRMWRMYDSIINNMKVKVVNEGALKENLLGNVIEYGHNDEDIQRWEMDAKVVGDENGVKNYSNLLNEITNFSRIDILFILSWKFKLWLFFNFSLLWVNDMMVSRVTQTETVWQIKQLISDN